MPRLAGEQILRVSRTEEEAGRSRGLIRMITILLRFPVACVREMKRGRGEGELVSGLGV